MKTGTKEDIEVLKEKAEEWKLKSDEVALQLTDDPEEEKKYSAYTQELRYSILSAGRKIVKAPSYRLKTKIPKFNNPKVQEYVEKYAKFINEYINAYRVKDMERIKILSASVNNITQESQDISRILSSDSEDTAKFTEYIQLISSEISNALQTE